MRIVNFSLESLVELSSVRLLLPPDLRTAEKRAAVAESMKEAFRRFGHVANAGILCLVLVSCWNANVHVVGMYYPLQHGNAIPGPARYDL